MIETIRKALYDMADPSYKAFHSKLIPTIDKNLVLGIPVPVLRKYARTLFREKAADSFMESLPHKYYEENNLHAFLIEQIKDFDACIKALEAFLPYVDNWATCDSMRPKSLVKDKQRLLEHVDRWLRSPHSYTVRYGIQILMLYFLEEDFQEVFLENVAKISHEDYYVKMMVAWYFATALAKQWESAVSYIESHKLDPWIHNKTIQKAVESYRITKEQKLYLKSLKAV